MERLGIDPERFRVEWISAAEGEKYARVITEMTAKLRSLDKENVRAQNAKAQPEITRRLERWRSVAHMAGLMAEESREGVAR